MLQRFAAVSSMYDIAAAVYFVIRKCTINTCTMQANYPKHVCKTHALELVEFDVAVIKNMHSGTLFKSDNNMQERHHKTIPTRYVCLH